MPTLEERVSKLEDRMGEQERLRIGQDQDLSDISVKLKAQDGLLKSLSATQSEHTATLAKHTELLERHTVLLEGHTELLERHTVLLEGHTVLLERHTVLLERHTETLDRHTAMLKNQETEIAWLRLDVSGLKDSAQQMTGMLHTLIERGGDR